MHAASTCPVGSVFTAHVKSGCVMTRSLSHTHTQKEVELVEIEVMADVWGIFD